jgi:predicted Zn-dependent protease
LVHSKDFSWRIRIIANDSVLNAFCTPGGYIYFYTGILKYLESEDQLAGVMGHEMAHAEKVVRTIKGKLQPKTRGT